MNNFLEKGYLLYEHSRYDEAQAEYLKHLSIDPQNLQAHLMLALCFSKNNKHNEALEFAENAVALAPDLDETYNILARVYLADDKHKKALKAIDEAISINPDSEDNWGVKSVAYAGIDHWEESLEAAKKGLELDADNTMCKNSYLLALNMLGRNDEAVEAINNILEDNPEDSYSHSNVGWAHLKQGNREKSLEHFRESLRLNPESESAKAGFVEALKAKHFVYYLFLRFALWLNSFKPGVRMALVIGAIIVINVLNHIARSYQPLVPYAQGLAVTYFCFVISVWMAQPLFDLLLFFNKDGRYALSKNQKSTSMILMFTLLFSTSVAIFLTMLSGFSFWLFIFPMFLVFPVITACHAKTGMPKKVMTAYAILMFFLLIAPFFKLIPSSGWTYYSWGCVLSTWVASFIPVD